MSESPDDRCAEAECAALSRLGLAAKLAGAEAPRPASFRAEQGIRGWWFQLRLWCLNTPVIDAVLSAGRSGASLAAAVERMMDVAGGYVGRFAVVDRGAALFEPALERRSPRGLWLLKVFRERRDRIQLDPGLQTLQLRLHRQTRPWVRKAERDARTQGLEFSFLSASPRADDPSAGAFTAPSGAKTALETAISDHAMGFEGRLTASSGAILAHCGGYIEGNSAYLVYESDTSAVAEIDLSLILRLWLMRELAMRDIGQIVFLLGCHGPLGEACDVTSRFEVIAIHPSLRGIATAILLTVTLRRTVFGEAVGRTLGVIARDRMAETVRLMSGTLNPPGRTLSLGRRYEICSALGLAFSCLAVAFGIALRHDVRSVPYITAYPALALTTFLAGAWAGFLTLILGGLGILYYVIPPYDSFDIDTTGDLLATIVYVLTALPLWRWFARQNARLRAG